MQTINQPTYPTVKIDISADLIAAVKAQVNQMRSAANPVELNDVSCEIATEYLEAVFNEMSTAVAEEVKKAGLTVGPVVLEENRIPMVDGDYDGNYRTNVFDPPFAELSGGTEIGGVVLQFLLWDKRDAECYHSAYFQFFWPSPTNLEVAFVAALMIGLSGDHNHRYIELPKFAGFDSNGIVVIDIFLGS